MSEIKHTMPDVIYAGLLASTFVNYGEWTRGRSALNNTSYTRTDIVQGLVEALELALHELWRLGLEDKDIKIQKIRLALNKAKGLGDDKS